MRLELAQTGEALALKVVDHCEPAAPVPRSLDERITAALANARGTLPFAELRFHCRVPAATLYTACRARCRRPRHQGTRWLSPRSLTAAIPAIVNARKAGRSQVPASRASYNLRERNWEVRAHFIPAQRGSFSWLSSKRRRRVAPPQASNLSVFWPFQPGNRFN
jgi:hypothetical protein